MYLWVICVTGMDYGKASKGQKKGGGESGQCARRSAALRLSTQFCGRHCTASAYLSSYIMPT